MKISASEIRVGMLLEYKDDLWQVLKTQHVKPGKGGAFAQVEMKSVNKNTKINERFRSSDSVEKASLEEINFNYSYEDENNFYFMDPKSYEQIQINKDLIGQKGKLLSENLEVTINFYNDKPIMVDLPNQVKCEVISTDVALKNKADYLAFGAFYSTSTKKTKYKPSLSILKKARKITKKPIVAIGGINYNNYKNLLLNKANLLAISGYIWKNRKLKPFEAIKKFEWK